MKNIRWNACLFICSLLLLASACAPQPSTASPLTGTLSELSGRVESKQAEETAFQLVEAGDVLQVNDQVQTGDDGRVRIDLSSGTILRVAPSSLFTLASNEAVEGGLATKLKLELGRIYIILSGGSVDVETPSGVASVLGSYMMVEIDPVTQDVVITCLEGNCSAGGIDFSDGQKVTFYYDPASGNYDPPILEDMSEEDFQKWLDENPEARQILDQVLAARSTATPTPTGILLPSPTATTVIITGGEEACFQLLAPPDNEVLNATGQITFTWEPQAGAVEYEVVFTSAGGAINLLTTTETSLTNYIDIFPAGGMYSWQVTALDADGAPICSATAFVFSKPAYVPPPPSNNDHKLRITLTPVPTRTPRPPTSTPVPSPQVCTYLDAQWVNWKLPCYCDPNLSVGNPPYCYGPFGPY